MIENTLSFWTGLGFGMAAGGLLVGLATWWRAHRLNREGRSIRALEAEHAQFRGQVNDHFVETAELINRLTDSYKEVFDHLSQGADQLVEDRVIRQSMPKVGDQEVRLKHIGHRVAAPDKASGDNVS